MIVDYKIVKCPDAAHVEAKVKTLINAGWQPHGSLLRDEIGFFYQAMAKHKPQAE